MLEMPSIESDFPALGGVDFNLLFCYEIPRHLALDLACLEMYNHGNNSSGRSKWSER
jgi:hypothetical protein